MMLSRGVSSEERCSAKPGKARLRADFELRVSWDFYSHISERQSWDGARDAADLLSFQQQLVSLRRFAVDLQNAQLAIHLAAIALPGDRLLARIAAFAEADVRFVETGFCGQDAIV